MVGVDDQVIRERPKERDCVYEECLEPFAEPNGNVIVHSKDSDTPIAATAGKGNIRRSVFCPITPTPCRENGDSVFIISTPLSVEPSQSPDVEGFKSTRNEEVVACAIDDRIDSPRTPDEGVFDPFAPGPDALLLAPMGKKVVKRPQKIVARRLDFDNIDDLPASTNDNKDVDALSEEVILESFYGTLLEAIILKQSEEFLAENPSFELEGLLHTPTSPPPLTGVAETCPGAPVKAATGKSINIDPGLCRKLQF